ncbi:MAG: hypothetical protein RQ922_00375 [Thermoproteota archaeon]|jgi:hypothetical protein|nr:hypothetical protein [Thermoproteota archaeon]
MIVIWVDRTKNDLIKEVFSMFDLSKAEIIFEEDGRYIQGNFKKPKQKKNVKILYSNNQENFKNKFAIEIIKLVNKPFYYKELKKIKRKDTLLKKYKDTHALLLLYSKS